jgi:transcriptional regulator with XRE-family HTH domain
VNKNTRARLEARAWRVGNAVQFLELSAEEAALVETKLLLSGSVRERRSTQGLSQSELARRLNSSQSRVAKIEAADPSVSADLLLRALFALGATPRDVASANRIPASPPFKLIYPLGLPSDPALLPRCLRSTRLACAVRELPVERSAVVSMPPNWWTRSRTNVPDRSRGQVHKGGQYQVRDRHQIRQTVRPSVEDDGAEGQPLQALLELEVAVHGDERIELTGRS